MFHLATCFALLSSSSSVSAWRKSNWDPCSFMWWNQVGVFLYVSLGIFKMFLSYCWIWHFLLQKGYLFSASANPHRWVTTWALVKFVNGWGENETVEILSRGQRTHVKWSFPEENLEKRDPGYWEENRHEFDTWWHETQLIGSDFKTKVKTPYQFPRERRWVVAVVFHVWGSTTLSRPGQVLLLPEARTPGPCSKSAAFSREDAVQVVCQPMSSWLCAFCPSPDQCWSACLSVWGSPTWCLRGW